MTDSGTNEPAKPKSLDIVSWRIPTKEELAAFMDLDARERRKPSVLAVRHHLSPLDVYCYLKGRFGEPNGFQNFLRRDTSDNLIHWDFILKAGDEDVYICGMSREVHFIVSAKLTDENWRELILGIVPVHGDTVLSPIAGAPRSGEGAGSPWARSVLSQSQHPAVGAVVGPLAQYSRSPRRQTAKALTYDGKSL